MLIYILCSKKQVLFFFIFKTFWLRTVLFWVLHVPQQVFAKLPLFLHAIQISVPFRNQVLYFICFRLIKVFRKKIQCLKWKTYFKHLSQRGHFYFCLSVQNRFQWCRGQFFLLLLDNVKMNFHFFYLSILLILLPYRILQMKSCFSVSSHLLDGAALDLVWSFTVYCTLYVS